MQAPDTSTSRPRRDERASRPVLSVVTPVYDEAEVLPAFAERLRTTLDGLSELGGDYEVVAVDDGSRDQSPVVLQRLRRNWPQLRILRLRTNAGHQAAISAGLVAARGAWVVTLDADLQDPPEVIGEMLEAVRLAHRGGEPVDVVYGVRTDRSTDSVFKRTTAGAFYTVMRRAGARSIRTGAGDYRLMSRATVDAVNALPESHRVLRLVVPSLDFPATSVGYRREARAAGRSKYPLAKMVRLSVDSLTGFSLAPLRLATWFGLGGFFAAAALLIYALIANLVGATIAGWTSTVVVVAGVGAIQLLCLGIMGEYVGRIYSTLQRRPTYYVAYDSMAGEPGEPSRERAASDADLTIPLNDPLRGGQLR